MALALPAAIALAGQSSPAQPDARAAAAGLVWDGDASKGTGVFDGLEKAPGSITVANAAPFGPSFRYETFDNANGHKERCESRGTKGFVLNSSKIGQTFFIGWRANLNPMPITRGRWISFWQLHWSGSGVSGGGPMTLRTLGDGQIHLQYVAPKGGFDKNIWSAPLPVGKWFSVVLAIRIARDNTGSIQFWFNGSPQRFSNGATTFNGATLAGDHVNLKWGVYRSGPNSGHAVEFVNHPRVGTTFQSVAP
jgi:hypothetical protein